MNKKFITQIIKIKVIIFYFVMITVNALANIIPINGVKTGEVAAKYENLFAPAGITFSIWGLIYLLLGVYTFYQFFQKDLSKTKLLNKIGIYFIISSIANSAWIFAWHYDLILFSVILIAVILICLIMIMNTIVKADLTSKEQWVTKLPFSVYFGWITVATIANITVYLVSIGWNGFGLSDSTWAIIMIIVGVVIGILTILKNNDLAYGLTYIWAYLGIVFKHISPNGFARQYPGIIITTLICIILLVIVEFYLLLNDRNSSSKSS